MKSPLFAQCATLDDAKKLYKKLAFQLHPDIHGAGSTAAFQDMQNQFHAFRPAAESEKFKGEFEQWNANAFMAVVDDLHKIPGLIVEICGSFIWISGDTKPNRDKIKAVDPRDYFRPAQWHREKEKWFFSPADYFRRSKEGLSMEEIRSKYGSEIRDAPKPPARRAIR